MWWLGINVYVRGVGGDAFTEIRGISETTASLGETFEWTLFRVPLLRGHELSKNDGEVNTAVRDLSCFELSCKRQGN